MYKKPIINFSTKLNLSAIGVIRISFGKIKKKILYFFFKKFFYKKIKPKIINYLCFYNFKNNILDKGLGLYFNSPFSYTGEDLFEYHGHGNPYILKIILNYFLVFLKKYKLKLSKKGSFTKKAFFNNKIDCFELNFLLNLFKNNNFKLKINNIKFDFNKKLFNLLKLIEDLEFLKISFKNNYFFKFFYYFKYIKKEIFFIIKNISFKKKILKNIIILGLVNSGKSTLFNLIIKNNFSLISNIKGTTKEIITRKIKINNFIYNISDTSGFDSYKNIIDYLNFLILIKKLFIFDLILYLFSNLLFYNSFYYIIKKKLKNYNFIFKIINKIDFLKLNSSIEYYIIIKKKINIKISSKFYLGLFFLINEIKKNNFLNFINFNNMFLKLIKKCYRYIIKSFIFLKKNKKDFFVEILKIKKIINFILNKKNKNFFNKIFKNFCLGK